MNVYYIRAAIENSTGIRLSLPKTVQYLEEEGLISKAQARKAIFYGYEGYEDGDEMIFNYPDEFEYQVEEDFDR